MHRRIPISPSRHSGMRDPLSLHRRMLALLYLHFQALVLQQWRDGSTFSRIRKYSRQLLYCSQNIHSVQVRIRAHQLKAQHDICTHPNILQPRTQSHTPWRQTSQPTKTHSLAHVLNHNQCGNHDQWRSLAPTLTNNWSDSSRCLHNSPLFYFPFHEDLSLSHVPTLPAPEDKTTPQSINPTLSHLHHIRPQFLCGSPLPALPPFPRISHLKYLSHLYNE